MANDNVKRPSDPALLADAVAFRAGLISYAGLLYSGQAHEAEVSREMLSAQWRVLRDPLTAKGLARTYRHAGKVTSIFEPVLVGVGGKSVVPTKHTITVALGALDAVIATLQSEPSARHRTRAPVVLDRGLVVVIALLAFGWSGDAVAPVSSLRAVSIWLLDHGSLLYQSVLIVLGIGGTIGGGLLIHLLHQKGWRDAWNSNPYRCGFYLLLLTISVVLGLTTPAK